MNQSNKALREAAIRKLRNADHAKCYEPAWHRDTADILIALVTNHIKELPSMQMENLPIQATGTQGWMITARNDLRQQLLQEIEEVSNADQ